MRPFPSFLLLLAAAALASCGSEPAAVAPDDGGGGPAAGTFGAPCVRNSDCFSRLCLTSGRCSRPCAKPADCPAPSWTCDPVAGAGTICQCTPRGAELCDGLDNDCDGRVDVGASCGGLLVCNGGHCECPMANNCGGSCVDRQQDVKHCGACNHACPAGAGCTAGSCTCPGGQTACGASCVDLQTDGVNCGTCKTKCATGATCVAGTCTCPKNQRVCTGTCVDTQYDAAHCGGCNHPCASGGSCNAGSCICPFGGMECAGICLNVNTNVFNCGACGNTCEAPSSACIAGKCSCPKMGLVPCGMTCVDLAVDNANCGGCGMACNASGAACTGGTCQCKMNGLSICGPACVDLMTDLKNCGKCGNACAPGPNQSAACTAGQCAFTCTGGFVDCDGNQQNGCELDARADVNNCGACGRKCTISACQSGYCKPVALSTNQVAPRGVDISGPYVFWINGKNQNLTGKNRESLMRVDKAGGNETVLLADQGSTSATHVAGNQLYWTSQPKNSADILLMRATLAGANPTVLHAGVAPGSTLRDDGVKLYWLDFAGVDDSHVMGIPLAGGNAAMLAANIGRTHWFSTGGKGLYWVEAKPGLMSTIKVYDTSMAMLSTFMTPVGPISTAADAKQVYYAIDQYPSTLYRADLDGKNPIKVTTSINTIQVIVVDEAYLYWMDSVASLKAWGIFQAPISGGPAVLLTASPTLGDFIDYSIAVDAAAVYFSYTLLDNGVESLGGVYKINK